MDDSLSNIRKVFSCTKKCLGDRSKNPLICLKLLSTNSIQCTNSHSSPSNVFSSVVDSSKVSSNSWFSAFCFIFIPMFIFVILCLTLFSAYIKTLFSLFLVNLTVNSSNGEEFETSKEILEREVDDVVILSLEDKYSLADKVGRKKTPFGFCMVNKEIDIVTSIACKLKKVKEFMAQYDDISEQLRGLFHEVESVQEVDETENEVIPCNTSKANENHD